MGCGTPAFAGAIVGPCRRSAKRSHRIVQGFVSHQESVRAYSTRTRTNTGCSSFRQGRKRFPAALPSCPTAARSGLRISLRPGKSTTDESRQHIEFDFSQRTPHGAGSGVGTCYAGLGASGTSGVQHPRGCYLHRPRRCHQGQDRGDRRRWWLFGGPTKGRAWRGRDRHDCRDARPSTESLRRWWRARAATCRYWCGCRWWIEQRRRRNSQSNHSRWWRRRRCLSRGRRQRGSRRIDLRGWRCGSGLLRLRGRRSLGDRWGSRFR